MQTLTGDVTKDVRISVGHTTIEGDLAIPPDADRLVILAYGSGSNRFSERERSVVDTFGRQRIATLLLDLLTPAEESLDRHSGELRFDVDLLASRIVAAIEWVRTRRETEDLPLGVFGAGTAAAAALIAAARRPGKIRAIVCRGARPELAGHALALVRCPVMLIAAGDDPAMIEMNRGAYELLACRKRLEIVHDTSQQFEGSVENVTTLAAEWFREFLSPSLPGKAEATHSERMRRVSEVMTPEPVYVRGDVMLPRVAQLMRDWDCGEIPVCEERKVVGVVTDRDITTRAVAESLNPLLVVASDVMTAPAATIQSEATIDRAVDMMESKRIARIPVVNERGELVGILSQSDLVDEIPACRAAELSRELANRPRKIARHTRSR